MTTKVTKYAVYEIAPDAREYGRLLKIYKNKQAAEKAVEKSIYRYMKERDVYIYLTFKKGQAMKTL